MPRILKKPEYEGEKTEKAKNTKRIRRRIAALRKKLNLHSSGLRNIRMKRLYRICAKWGFQKTHTIYKLNTRKEESNQEAGVEIEE